MPVSEHGFVHDFSTNPAMPPAKDSVRVMGIALGVGLGCFLATAVLAFFLAETRNRLGQDEWYIWWLPGKSWGKHFDPVWYPILFGGSLNLILGWLLGLKMRTMRHLDWALVGAVISVIVVWFLGNPMLRIHGQAGHNTLYLCLLTMAIAGAYAGVCIAEPMLPLVNKNGGKDGMDQARGQLVGWWSK